MKQIESLTNAYIKDLVRLQKKKGRQEQGKFLVEGWHMVEEAHSAGILETILTTEPKLLEGVETIQVTKPILEKLSLMSSGASVIGVCRQKEEAEKELKRVLFLDNVQDPGNVGTLIRSAYSFGMDGVIASEDSADFWNPKVLQASQGAAFHLTLKRGNIKEEIEKFPHSTFGACLHQKSIPLQEVDNETEYGLVIGNEGSGIKEDVLAVCSQLVHIEMDAFESLNAGVAGSILMYHLRFAK